MRKTRDALEILDYMIGDDPELRRQLARESINVQVGQILYDARVAAGLTHAQLARRIGITAAELRAAEENDFDDGDLLQVFADVSHELNLEVKIAGQVRPQKATRATRKKSA